MSDLHDEQFKAQELLAQENDAQENDEQYGSVRGNGLHDCTTGSGTGVPLSSQSRHGVGTSQSSGLGRSQSTAPTDLDSQVSRSIYRRDKEI
ncbi:hypothetical protein CPLU01_08871 [Colletotrichum plurivorum]|uniref:Uncharacterized protein n=1 Tax=Colletotrichum plurivorum TaxID=2175906 RepID=A0A8H6NBW2_9PEZI|nr:hypothetical protein CPLU01_08871 [Colletotrichum plurivorum]